MDQMTNAQWDAILETIAKRIESEAITPEDAARIVRVNSGAFIRGFVEAVRQNAELEDYANPALAELATRLEREEMIL